MESSIHSFTLTATKLASKSTDYWPKLMPTNQKNCPSEYRRYPRLGAGVHGAGKLHVGNKTKVLLQDMDLIRFRQEWRPTVSF